MRNFGDMMKQAQEMQSKMGEAQKRIASIEAIGSSGGGMVEITLSGKGEMRSVKIDPSLLKVDDMNILEDLLVAAHQAAKKKVEALVEEEMANVTGGVKLPLGFKLPF